jgi:hypothetical protein
MVDEFFMRNSHFVLLLLLAAGGTGVLYFNNLLYFRLENVKKYIPSPTSLFEEVGAIGSDEHAGKLHYLQNCLKYSINPKCFGLTSRLDVPSIDAWKSHLAFVLNRTSFHRSIGVHEFGYFGPWIENVWIDSWSKNITNLLKFYPVIPLFVQWTDGLFGPDKIQVQLKEVITDVISPEFIYATVTQHDYGEPAHAFSCEMYNNVLVLSAGGWGNVALPLIKGSHGHHGLSSDRPRSTLFSFIGAIHRSRVLMLKGFNESTFPKDWFTPQQGDWKGPASSSVFMLAPRGFGRNSFRLSELVQYGSMPIILGDDIPWTPYDDWLDHTPPGIPNVSTLAYGDVGKQQHRKQPLFGVHGIGFALRYDQLPAFLCQACVLFDADGNVDEADHRLSGANLEIDFVTPEKCSCDEVRWRKTAEAISVDGKMILPSTSIAFQMEQRVAQYSHLFYYDGAIEEVHKFLENPESSMLSCNPKPFHYGDADAMGWK